MEEINASRELQQMQQVELDEVETQLARLLEDALRGEEVVITQADQPVLKLVRIPRSVPRRKRGSAKGQLQIAPDFDAPLDDFQAYMA
jgi:antitoxin (DNA-binding transcriptional repressor) of toxin-antitoxin stability system